MTINNEIRPCLGKQYYGIVTTETLAKHGITINDVFDKVITIHKSIAELFNMHPSSVQKIIENLQIPIYDFVGYIYNPFQPQNSILIEQNHGERTYYDKSTRCYKTQFYNLYLVKKSNVCRITDVIEYILHTLYPQIFYCPSFYKVEERFKSKLIDKITPQTRLHDIGTILTSEFIDCYEYTVQDLIDLLCHKKSINEKVQKPLFNIYYDEFGKDPISIYLKLPNVARNTKEDISLTIPLDAIKRGDFSLVENCEVHSIPCYPNEKKWFKGKQKNAPYFNHPFIAELKNCFNYLVI